MSAAPPPGSNRYINISPTGITSVTTTPQQTINKNVVLGTKVPQLESPHNPAHSARLSKKLFNGADFYVGGTATFIGNPNLKPTVPVFCDGLGSLWSAIYVCMDVTHTINDSGYTTQAVLYTNSLFATEADRQKAKAEAAASQHPENFAVFKTNPVTGEVTVSSQVGPNAGSAK